MPKIQKVTKVLFLTLLVVGIGAGVLRSVQLRSQANVLSANQAPNLQPQMSQQPPCAQGVQFTAPLTTTYYQPGNSIPITWQSCNVPAGSGVLIQLYGATLQQDNAYLTTSNVFVPVTAGTFPSYVVPNEIAPGSYKIDIQCYNPANSAFCTGSYATSVGWSNSFNIQNKIIKPIIVSTHPLMITTHSSHLNVSYVNNAPVTGWFEYGLSTLLGTSTIHTPLNAVTLIPWPSTYGDQVSGLLANTTYYFRAVIQGSAGVTYSPITSFTTLP